MECSLFDQHSQTYNENCFYEHYYGNNEISLYERFNQLLLSFIIFNTGLVISCWFSGYFLLDKVEDDEEEEKKPDYKNLYPIDVMNESLKKKKDISKNIVVLENTPEGNVLLRYNSENEGFEYWCDNKNVKFDYLETVARKFVIANFCIDLYKDRFKNIEEQKKKIKEEENNEIDEEKINEELSDEIVDDTDDVFVKPKKKEKSVKKSSKKENREVVATESNKYLYKGKINEYEWLQKSKEENTVKKMSYSDWFNLR